jgi:nitrogen fixation protein NifU and related proteins
VTTEPRELRIPDDWETRVGPMADATHHARITGPCGDTMEVWIKEENGKAARTAMYTDGCGTSLLCALTACFWAEGRDMADVAKARDTDLLERLEGLPESSRHCATLAAWTLREAVTGIPEPPPPYDPGPKTGT